MARNLLVSGGLAHDFDASSAALARLLAQDGIETEVRVDIDEALAGLGAGGGYDLLTVNACRFAMTADQQERMGAQHHLVLGETARTAVLEHVRGGGGLLAMHAACICFGDWPQWGPLLRASWVWGASSHPPLGPLSVEFTGTPHDVTRGLGGFDMEDEQYGGLEFHGQVEPLAVATTDGRRDPVMWAHEFGAGRVFVDLLGHHVPSLEHPTHAEVIRRAARWATRREGSGAQTGPGAT